MALHFDHVNITVVDIEHATDFLRIVFPHFQVRGGGEGKFGEMTAAWRHLGTDEEYVSLNQTNETETFTRDGSRLTGIDLTP